MRYQKIDTTYVLRLDPGDELVQCLTDLAEKENIAFADVTGLGAVNHVTLGIFDVNKKQYYSRDYRGCYEIGNIAGSISRMHGKPYIHLHMTIGNPATQECHSGHLNKAMISATAELTLRTLPQPVERRFDEAIGLNIYDFQ